MKTTNSCGLLLLHQCHSPSPPLLILFHHRHRHRHRKQPQGIWPPPVQFTNSVTTALYNHHLLLQPVLLNICRSRRWDSNAESFRTQNSDYDFDDEDTENDDSLEQGLEVLEDYIDSIWIFKVFRSYGWTLPFILVSILLATGLKAFLMALALPLGQSTFSFAMERMWSGKKKRPKRKINPEPKRKTNPETRSRARSSRTVKWGKEKGVGTQGNKKAKMGYQSWVPGHDDSTDTVEKKELTFGGWDELDTGSEVDVWSSTNTDQRADSSQNSSSDKSRLNMRIRKSDTPLFLRLLIAVFPFLGSWTKML